MDEKTIPALYEIRLRGRLATGTLTAFPRLSARAEGKQTVLSGSLPDQAALFGALGQVESLGLELISLKRVN